VKTIVYVDGYNLYYGLLRRSPWKWLDLFALFQNHVLTDANILEVRYYTAPVLARMCDDPVSPQRQRLYLQALRKQPPSRVTIVEGRMVATTPILRLVEPINGLERVRVQDFVEKQTDVNLACDMLSAAWTGACEQIVLCSNDSDLKAALAAIRQHCPGVRLGLVAPVAAQNTRHLSRDLAMQVHWAKALSPVHLASAQLPARIPGTTLRRPECW